MNTAKQLLKKIIDSPRVIPLLSSKLWREVIDYLHQPEPEPVAWLMWFRKFEIDTPELVISNSKQDDAFPVYTEQPDQSARIAELEQQLAELQNKKAVFLSNANIRKAWPIGEINFANARAIEEAVLINNDIKL